MLPREGKVYSISLLSLLQGFMARKYRRLLHWELRKRSEADGSFQDGDYEEDYEQDEYYESEDDLQVSENSERSR